VIVRVTVEQISRKKNLRVCKQMQGELKAYTYVYFLYVYLVLCYHAYIIIIY
jgi:hypothetical protein